MKKLLSLSTAVALFGMLLITSCAKEEEPEPTPTFHGIWDVSEHSKDYGHSTYNLTISDSSNATHILLAYLYGFNKKTYAVASGNFFTIPVQSIQGYNVSGKGAMINANHVEVSYLVQTTATHYDTVKAVLTR